MCRADCVETRCVACDWRINKFFDVMVHCRVFLQTERCPRADYPTTIAYARAALCGRCNPLHWPEDVNMQPEDVDMQPEDVDMQQEAEAPSSDKARSVEPAEPNSGFQALIDEVARRSAEEEEKEREEQERRAA
ncbi:hypothetical protein NW768_010951 [Fusarium equiseti]|uniref:Uncharacterized protein n=1 Tax=Fusarium equiseti TaxID=61235 RepID=A0ABQ8QZ49_FUSEQ|nr:hypothetical protein NW768_010951 [Fusarium equiseti]